MAILKLPPGQIMQIAFTVPDLEQAMIDYGRDFNIGVWFAFRDVAFERLIYRGVASNLKIAGAIGYSGDMMYELIQQKDKEPSVYQDTIAERGHGFHHVCIVATSLAEEIETYKKRGYVHAMSVRSAMGIEAAYMDAGPKLPGMIEIMELSDSLFEIFQPAYDAVAAWDGGETKIHWV